MPCLRIFFVLFIEKPIYYCTPFNDDAENVLSVLMANGLKVPQSNSIERIRQRHFRLLSFAKAQTLCFVNVIQYLGYKNLSKRK